MSRLVRLYPRAWRARYGEELLDLAAARPLGIGGSIDLIRGALDAHRHPELVDPALEPAALDEAVTPQRLRDLVVARRLGLGSIVGGALWLVAWAVAAAGPTIHEADGTTYQDGSAAAPFMLGSALLLSAGLVGQLIRLPSRVLITRLGAVAALLLAPMYGVAPWLLPIALIIAIGLVVLAVGAWWAEAWPAWAAAAMVIAVIGTAVLVVPPVLGLSDAVIAPIGYLLAFSLMSTLWFILGATLLPLPTVVLDAPEPGPPAVETLPA